MDILFTTVVIILIVAALMSMVISFFVFALYYNFESKKPHEVVEISQDGFVYKLENGRILSVFKIKKYILKGYIY
jgi:phosphate/sulfate permease